MHNPKTLQDISQELGTEESATYDLLRFLTKTGIVKVVGSVRIPGRRGRGKLLYQSSGDLKAQLTSVIETLAKVA